MALISGSGIQQDFFLANSDISDQWKYSCTTYGMHPSAAGPAWQQKNLRNYLDLFFFLVKKKNLTLNNQFPPLNPLQPIGAPRSILRNYF